MELAARVNVGHTSGGGAGDQYMPFDSYRGFICSDRFESVRQSDSVDVG